MYYRKKITYPGRWLVKLMEAGLIFGVIFFTVDALQGAFAPEPYAEPLVIHHVQPVEVVRVEPQVVQPQVQAAPEYTDYDYFMMAYNHQTADEYYEAIVDYTRVLELNPDFDSAWLNRGVAYEQLNNEYRAMQDFNRFMLREGTSIVSHRGVLTGARLDVEMTENLIYALNFYARAGETLDISVTAQNGDVVDPLVLVVDMHGNPVVAKDDTLRQDGSLISMDAYITNFEALSTGRYTLLISHAGGGSEGTVQLELEINR